jgi:L-ribulose-5-phosphate 4-epimerase
MKYEELRLEALRANCDLVHHGLVLFTWGNASACDRTAGVLAIKPSGVAYNELTAEDIVIVDLDGQTVDGRWKPSSDTPTHAELYRSFSGVGGIVHTHSHFSTVWSQAACDLPALGTTHADHFYGAVPCTRELSPVEIRDEYELNTGRVIVECFRTREIDPMAVPGVLVAGHAPFTWGKTASEAVHNAVVLEECSKLAFETLGMSPSCAGVSQDLLNKHYLRKHGANAYYGQK